VDFQASARRPGAYARGKPDAEDGHRKAKKLKARIHPAEEETKATNESRAINRSFSAGYPVAPNGFEFGVATRLLSAPDL
jgi:hypothetical protein